MEKRTTHNIDFYEMHDGLKSCLLSFRENDVLQDLPVDGTSMLWVTCLKGEANFRTDAQDIPVHLRETESAFVAIPTSQQTMNIRSNNGEVVVAYVGLKLLHELLTVNFDMSKMDRSSFDYKAAPKVIPLSPKTVVDLKDWFLDSDRDPFKQIKDYGNFLASFSSLMGSQFGKRVDKCPVRLNLEAEAALREAHHKIISNLQLLPDTQALALEVKIPENVLTEGFKHVYGSSIYKYYLDYKMEKSLAILSSGQKLVKEVAFDLGYQSPSHFITAFKKKYGMTPKKYLNSERS